MSCVRRCEMVLFACLAALLAGCSGDTDTMPLPETITGTYVSTNELYADRSFTLTPDAFIVDLGEMGVERYAIENVVREPQPQEPERVLYTVVYLNSDSQEYKLTFFDQHDDGKHLVLKNQPNVHWTKRSAEL